MNLARRPEVAEVKDTCLVVADREQLWFNPLHTQATDMIGIQLRKLDIELAGRPAKGCLSRHNEQVK